MENYVTWEDLVQIMIAFSTASGAIIALITLIYSIIRNNKKK